MHINYQIDKSNFLKLYSGVNRPCKISFEYFLYCSGLVKKQSFPKNIIKIDHSSDLFFDDACTVVVLSLLCVLPYNFQLLNERCSC